MPRGDLPEGGGTIPASMLDITHDLTPNGGLGNEAPMPGIRGRDQQSAIRPDMRQTGLEKPVRVSQMFYDVARDDVVECLAQGKLRGVGQPNVESLFDQKFHTRFIQIDTDQLGRRLRQRSMHPKPAI